MNITASVGKSFWRITYLFPTLKSTMQPLILLDVMTCMPLLDGREQHAPQTWGGFSWMGTWPERERNGRRQMKNWKALSQLLTPLLRQSSVVLSSAMGICPPPSAPPCQKLHDGGASLPSHPRHHAKPHLRLLV